MDFVTLLSRLFAVVSGTRAKAHVTEIARHHRIQASPGYEDAADYVREALDRIGVDCASSSFPADGRTETHGWTAPMGWRIRGGDLRQLEPAEQTLCSYADVPISILAQSAAGSAEAELAHIGKGTAPADIEGVDLRGRFALACGRTAEVLRQIRGKGAAGLVLYPDGERAAASYDLVQYAGMFPTAQEIDTTPMGFSISRRAADRLIAQLAKGTVRLRGDVDADYFRGSMRTLEARIGGSDPRAGETLLVAHLCHPQPSANDNASGSGLLLEIARVIAEISHERPLRNAVRFLWVPEFNGAIPWAAANAEILRDVRAVINLDMVGQSPERVGEPLRAFRAPNVRASYLDACLEPILTRIASDERSLSAQGSRRPLHWIIDLPSGGSDHLVFQASPHDLPAVMLGHDDPYWHTDLDTMDRVDATRLKQVGVLAAALAMLPTWAHDNVRLIGEWLVAWGSRELAAAAAVGRQLEGERERSLLDTALRVETQRAESLRSLVGSDAWCFDRHVEALKSLSKVIAGSTDARQAFSAARPHRVLDGPVRHSIVDGFTEEERVFFDEKLSAGHRAAVESLANLCDGTRSIEEIALHLTLDFRMPFGVEDTRKAIGLLAKAGYVAL